MKTNEGKTTLLAWARVAARELANSATSQLARADACLDLLDELGVDSRIEGFRRALQALPVEERHYWITRILDKRFDHLIIEPPSC